MRDPVTRDEFSDLALSYLDEVYAFARDLVERDWEADDLVQATYERAFDHWQSLDDPGHCRAWLFQIARNLWIDANRKKRPQPDLRVVGDEGPLPGAMHVSADQIEQFDRALLGRALDEIPETQREAVLLCDLWGFTYDEIAEITDVPMGTVQSRIARGRNKLVERLEGLDHTPESLEDDSEGGER
jgi:RNA polymerase sigma-70 factor (ECF subfamily)